MKVLLVLAALTAASCAVSIPDEQVRSQFKAFKAEHGRQYATEVEESFRMKIFKENLIRVAKHNERFNKGEVTFTVGINQFADMHSHEVVKARNGFKAQQKKAPSAIVHRAPVSNDEPWPWSKKVDWRTKGLVTNVKDQGSCGSCWAFSTTGALEGQLAKKTGKLVSLSEQNLVDCTMDPPYYLGGCYGGDMDWAFRYINDNAGIDTEDSYPYTAVTGTSCLYNVSNSGGTDTGLVDVNTTEKDLQHAVETVGPIAVAIDASQWSFQMYSGGVYYDAACDGENLDHAVLAVGFGSNAIWGSNDYWLVKNSWGANWDEKGYIRMARNKNNACGIANEASYPTV